MNEHHSQAFEHWNHAVQAICGRFVTHCADGAEPFVGHIAHRNLDGLNVADIHVNARAIVRERGKAGRADDRFYFLVLQRHGRMSVQNAQQHFVLEPGELALLDSAQGYEMRPQGLINQLSVHLGRESVERALPASAPRFGKLASGSLSARLLKTLLLQLSEDDAASSEHQGHALQDALLSLVVPLLRGAPPKAAHPSLRSLAERLIQDSLLEPLSPNDLATRLNVSVRQLYRQFAGDGDSLCRFIQRQRLERSAQELVGGTLPITTLAYKWGFTDAAHFSRLFKRHYGLSPRRYRDLQGIG
ncbi:transcriptional regulator FeaR [Pseudomonas oryzihabitans]|uniref:transcriptional regulator FeaR n=1 Tax=Pseudomonas oryzihabitans TaxID=47885 RepID=UPI0028961E3B|nr:transcriptional regulator FeaR [Pseudomonas oryzihabitans]MDT3722449.1 transcriptional regulator FeaR [Pseudomonas oryzihabitans]